MDYILLAVYIAVCGAQGIFYKIYHTNAKSSLKNAPFVFATLMGFTSAIIMFIISGFTFQPSFLTVAIGVEQGIVFFAFNILLMEAVTQGASYSIISISSQAGAIILSILETTLIFNNRLGVWKLVPIMFIMVSFVLLNYDGIKHKSLSSRCVFFYVSIFAVNGFYGVSLDVHQQLMNKTERSELMIITYLVSALSAILWMILKKHDLKLKEFAQSKLSFLMLIICSAVSACSIYFALYLMGKINVAIVYAMCNGGTLVTATIYSAIFLKEKMPITKILGVIIALACILLLTMIN